MVSSLAGGAKVASTRYQKKGLIMAKLTKIHWLRMFSRGFGIGALIACMDIFIAIARYGGHYVYEPNTTILYGEMVIISLGIFISVLDVILTYWNEIDWWMR